MPTIPVRKSLEEQLAAQEPPIVLQEGETALQFRDIAAMVNALSQLANKALVRDHRVHVTRTVRFFKDILRDCEDEQVRIQSTVPPEDVAAAGAAPSDRVISASVIAANREAAALMLLYVAVKMPSPITDAMLPKNDKDHPNNEDGLAAILADLGPMYPLPDEETPK